MSLRIMYDSEMLVLSAWLSYIVVNIRIVLLVT